MVTIIKKTWLLLLLTCLLTPCAWAQTEPAKKANNWRIEGQMGISTNGKAVFLCFGGPNLRFQYKKIAFGLSLYPSLRFWEDKPRTFITPTLGMGAYLMYKRWGLACPMYYNAGKNEWMPTGGIIFRLSK
jgi:hypothetical protein